MRLMAELRLFIASDMPVTIWIDRMQTARRPVTSTILVTFQRRARLDMYRRVILRGMQGTLLIDTRDRP